MFEIYAVRTKMQSIWPSLDLEHAPFTTDKPTYHIMTLGNWNGLGGQYGQVVGVILLFSWSRSAQGDHGV